MTIGIDLGGTNVRCGLVENGSVVTRLSEPCRSDQSEHVVLEQIEGLIRQVMNPSVKGIGIGVPSVVDVEKGIVYNVTNIPSWIEVHLKDYMESKFGVPVHVNNDANCFALGEHRYRCHEGNAFRNTIGVTLGTGVGAGVIIDNRLYSGSNTGAGEIGCLPYLDRTLEDYCGSNFFADYHNTTGKEALELARSGDANALKMWEEFGKHIGIAVKIILYAYDPDAIIFGGSITNAYSFFEAAMRKEMESFFFPETIKKLQILISTRDDISLLGAAALCD
jgi:glucokinase